MWNVLYKFYDSMLTNKFLFEFCLLTVKQFEYQNMNGKMKKKILSLSW